MKRKTFKAKNINVSGPYSHGVDGGDYIFLSGQTAMNREGVGDLKGKIREQTQIAFDNLLEVLQETGLTEAHVVKVNVYLTSMDYFEEMNQVYQEIFNPPYPARTCVAVYQLPLGADVEIEMIVRK